MEILSYYTGDKMIKILLLHDFNSWNDQWKLVYVNGVSPSLNPMNQILILKQTGLMTELLFSLP